MVFKILMPDSGYVKFYDLTKIEISHCTACIAVQLFYNKLNFFLKMFVFMILMHIFAFELKLVFRRNEKFSVHTTPTTTTSTGW